MTAGAAGPRLLMVSTFYDSHLGGLEIVAARVADELAARGFQVRWLATHCTAPPEGGRVVVAPIPGSNWIERRFGVPMPLIEAGQSFGASPWQLLWKVELPYAMPTIMAGLTQCIMLSLSMVVIAALVGADGLGKPVVRALNTVNVARGFEAGLAIVLLAIMLDRLCRRPGSSGEG